MKLTREGLQIGAWQCALVSDTPPSQSTSTAPASTSRQSPPSAACQSCIGVWSSVLVVRESATLKKSKGGWWLTLLTSPGIYAWEPDRRALSIFRPFRGIVSQSP